MKRLIALLFFISLICLSGQVNEADETNVVSIDLEELKSLFAANFSAYAEAEFLLTTSNELSTNEAVRQMNFLLGSKRTKSPDKLSLAYRENFNDYLKKGGIPLTQYSKFYHILLKENGARIATFTLNETDGWGYFSSRSFDESYLLHGEFLESTRTLVRWTEKRNEDWYRKQLSKRYLITEKGLSLERFEDNGWVYGIVMPNLLAKEASQEYYAFGRAYLEDFAKSLSVAISIQPIGALSELSLNEFADTYAQEALAFTRGLSELIFQKVKDKGIFPDDGALKNLKLERLDNFGEAAIPACFKDVLFDQAIANDISDSLDNKESKGRKNEDIVLNKEILSEPEKQTAANELYKQIFVGTLLLVFIFVLWRIFRNKV